MANDLTNDVIRALKARGNQGASIPSLVNMLEQQGIETNVPMVSATVVKLQKKGQLFYDANQYFWAESVLMPPAVSESSLDVEVEQAADPFETPLNPDDFEIEVAIAEADFAQQRKTPLLGLSVAPELARLMDDIHQSTCSAAAQHLVQMITDLPDFATNLVRVAYYRQGASLEVLPTFQLEELRSAVVNDDVRLLAEIHQTHCESLGVMPCYATRLAEAG